MALPSISDVKSELRISTSGDDSILQLKMYAGIAFFSQFQKMIIDELNVTYEHEITANEIKEFCTLCRMSDISAVKIYASGADNVESELTTTNYTQTGRNRWKIIGLAEIKRVRIQYTSAAADAIIGEILKEWTQYYYLRALSGSIGKSNYVLGQVSGQFIAETDFKAIIYERLREVFLLEG